MPQYADLTGPQQAALQGFLNLMRPAVGTGAKYINGTVVPLMLDWGNFASNIIAGLDTGAVIPNTSGLTGAQDLSKEQIQALMTGFANSETNYANQQVQLTQAAACGAANMMMH